MKQKIKSLLKRVPGVRRYAPRIRALLSSSIMEKQNPVNMNAAQLADCIQSYVHRAGSEMELFRILRERGIYLMHEHYYRPFVAPKDLPANYWSQQSRLSGLTMNADEALQWVKAELTEYIKELRSFLPIEKNGGASNLYLNNGTYMAVDAHMYYAIIRSVKPKRIIEVGAGHSTLFAFEALRRGNLLEHTELHVIEPFPESIIKTGLEDVAVVRKSFVQDVEIEFFDSLDSGDILFIDSTHVIRENGDVLYLFLDVLPRLKPGVLVHVHDISLPEPYPQCYLDYGWFWNEQYLLQAYLINNSRVKILWPGNYLMCREPDRMLKIFPEIREMRRVYPESEPTAFWFQTV